MTKDTPYLDLVRTVRFRPVFILGPARSGTTILYKMLALSNCFNVVTLYHVLRPGELLFNHLQGQEEQVKSELLVEWAQRERLDRQIDAISVHPDLEEEYGHVLGDLPWHKHMSRQNLDVFLSFAKKIQFISAADKLLLLKNPWDFTNFIFLRDHFPQARFIFIHRHPTDILNSTIRATRLSLQQPIPYLSLLSRWYRRLFAGNRRPILAQAMLHSDLSPGTYLFDAHLARNFRQYMDHIHQLEPSCYRVLRYEDLCLDPQRVLDTLLRFLSVEYDSSSVDWTAMIKPRRLPVSKGIRFHGGLVHRLSKRYWQHFGYRP